MARAPNLGVQVFLLWAIAILFAAFVDSNQWLRDHARTLLLPAGILGAAVTLYTAAIQLRAKVSSENRQKWIDEVRNTLAEVMNHIPQATIGNDVPMRHLIESGNANRARLKLELLLNPSEKDHRTLGTLLRKAYRIPVIAIDIPVNNSLPMIRDHDPSCCTKAHEQLITWIIRLSNAMLKREWELVKYGQ